MSNEQMGLLSRSMKIHTAIGSAHTLLAKFHLAVSGEASELREDQRKASLRLVEHETRDALSELVRSVNWLYGGYCGVLDENGKLPVDDKEGDEL